MKRFALALLLACGCAQTPPIDCVTRCGLRLAGDVPHIDDGAQWTCAELQRTEDAVLAAFDHQVSDDRFRNACERISGWVVVVRPTVFVDSTVGGRAHCASGVLEVGALSPLNSTLPHELAHAVQSCQPLAPVESSDPDHSNWQRDGIASALEEVEALAYVEYRRCSSNRCE